MRIDSLVRVIGAADFSAFRDIALLCLKRRGFQPSLTDGPHDGGMDFSVHLFGPVPTRFAVQISVDKEWERKLRQDALKVREHLAVDALLFITSRRIPEATFQKIADDILRTTELQVQKMDVQHIASLAETDGFTNDVLGKLGIDVQPAAPRAWKRLDLRQNVAYACAFFGTDAQAFRRTVIENAVLAAVFQAGGSMEREATVDRVALSLGLSANQRVQVTSAFDRMIQDGRLVGKNGTIAMAATARDNWASLTALQRRERAALAERLEALLPPHRKSKIPRKEAVEAILEDLGALSLDAARATTNALDATEPAVLAQEPLRLRLRHLDAVLDTLGLVDREPRRELLRELVELCSASPFGRAITAGEVFINLMSLETPQLFRAFGGDRALRVVLDASVAMPLLCSLVYDTAGRDLFVAAKHAYEQMVAHGTRMVLPRDYLEEVASHLLDACTLYHDLVDLDPDLRGSKNAFVAHYVAMRAALGDRFGAYATYLEAFGMTAALARGERAGAREILMGKLRLLFHEYGVETESLDAGAASRRRAEKALAYAMRARQDLWRPPILVRHDANTLGWLIDHASDPAAVHVMCTWDRLHPHVRAQEDGGWDVLDPIALGDVLSLAAPGDEDVTIASPVLVALALSGDAERRGAAVWDALVEIEKEGLHDGPLRVAALAFKRTWMEETAKDRRVRDMQEAWESWKATHLPRPALP